MKTNKILKVMCTIIIIILLVCISFIGIYALQNNRRVNILKDYTLGMTFAGGREITLSPSTETETNYYDTDGKKVDVSDLSEEEIEKLVKREEPVNPEDVLNADKYLQTKKVIQKRLDTVGIQEYTISLNEETGDILLKVAETNTLDNIIYSMFETGKLELTDTETGEVLLNNQDVKNAQVGYYNTTSDSSIYLTINLNKEGAKKLEDISSKYVSTTDEDGNTTTKTVTLTISGETVSTTYFAEKLTTGQIQIKIGDATSDASILQSYVLQAGNTAATLNSGESPVVYDIQTNTHIGSPITSNIKTVALCIAVIAITVMIAYSISEHKDRGIIASITFVGFIAALLLLIRFTNTTITVESILAIILTVIFNYVFLNILLRRLNNHKEEEDSLKTIINKTTLKSIYLLVPALVIALVFCFINVMSINSFGIALFWGIIMFVTYTLLITKTLLLNFEYLFEE